MIVTAVTVVLLLAACRRQTAVAPASASGSGQDPGSTHEPGKEELMTIEGTLKPTVESGGWILATKDGEYLLLKLSPFKDQDWFVEGSRLRARGRIERDVLTTFMQGTPFIVSELAPIDDSGNRKPREGRRR